MSTIIFQVQSSIILVLFILGYMKAKSNLSLHKRIMLSAVIWDILLILQIEFTRSAIEKATTVTNNSSWLNIHVSFAILTVIFYGITIFLALKKRLSQHRNVGKITILLRALTYITSFFALN